MLSAGKQTRYFKSRHTTPDLENLKTEVSKGFHLQNTGKFENATIVGHYCNILVFKEVRFQSVCYTQSRRVHIPLFEERF